MPNTPKPPKIPKIKTPNLAQILDIQRTPEPHRYRRYTPRTKSVRPELAGIGVCSFLAKLFALNEELPTRKKMTDAEIARQVVENYPDSKAAKNFQTRSRTVQYYRCLYNSGILTPRGELAAQGPPVSGTPLPPRHASQRYDQFGRIVKRRGGPVLKDPPNPTRSRPAVVKKPLPTP